MSPVTVTPFSSSRPIIGPSSDRCEFEYADSISPPATFRLGLPAWRLKQNVWVLIVSVKVRHLLAALGTPLWQVPHAWLSSTFCTAASQGTPTTLPIVNPLETRWARGVVSRTCDGPDATAIVIPRWITVVLARSSWQ